MTDTDTPTPDTETNEPGQALANMPDDALHQLITKAQDILKRREDERRKSALTEMRRLAKEHGLSFSAKKKPARKRGRLLTPKSAEAEER